MNRVIVELSLFFITALILFQSPLNAHYFETEHAVTVILDEAAEDAAVEGRFTPAIIDRMVAVLSDELGYEETSVEFTGTQALTYRGEAIEGRLRVPSPPRFVFRHLFGSGEEPEYIEAYVTQMSEYRP